MEHGKDAEDYGSPSSSSSDFYSTDAPVARPVEQSDSRCKVSVDSDGGTRVASSPTSNTVDVDTDVEGTPGPDLDEDDASSNQAMELSPSSLPGTPEPTPSTRPVGAKRKLSSATDTNGAAAIPDLETAKRQRISPASVLAPLPPELWQLIFSFLSPAMLCRCLRVSRLFKELLTEASAPLTAKKDTTKVRMMDSEVIWSHSRKCFYPFLPRPLARFSELEMLRLITGKSCEFCRKAPLPSPGTTNFNAGPGRNGRRVIWPFGIRSCGECLKARVLTDTETLSTQKRFSKLRSGVTFGYLLPDLNFVHETVRLSPPGIPAVHRASRVYYKPDLEAIEREEREAEAFGEGAADEWHKGLGKKGKDAMVDSARWEQYERQIRSDRPGATIVQILRDHDPSAFPGEHGSMSELTETKGLQPLVMVNGTHPLPRPVHVFPTFLPQHQQHVRPSKNAAQAEEIRKARKLDIERRCRELVPPLMPEVLQHMDSFHAALQIVQPMTDDAWELLKPRIMAQKEAAELVEHERSTRLAALQATLPIHISGSLSRSSKESHDREYEMTQQPLRERLGQYADDMINGQWHGGKALSKENAPIFAANVLRHVWHSFHQDREVDPLPRSDFTRGNDGQDSPPREPFLSLDNMKWVYDHKVRPLADSHRREHFLCSTCPDTPSPKWFAFEGLIQHYAAKHTTAFSKGNIVVHWQSAPWPEDFPFHLNPESWLKLERRLPDSKGKSRSRITPQNSHDGPFMPPSNTSRPAPFSFANGHAVPAAAHTALPRPHPLPKAPTGMLPHQGNGTLEAVATDANQVDSFANEAAKVWFALDGIDDLIACIRVHTVLHHAALRSRQRFSQDATLDLVTDVLLRDQEVRPLRNAPGLACKVCVSNDLATNGSSAYYSRIRNVKLNNTWSLVAHFKLHAMENPTLDWTRDMIELPEDQLIRPLLQTGGMNDDKLALIAAAVPGVFPFPLPRIGVVSGKSLSSQAGGTFRDRQGKKAKKRKNALQINGNACAEQGHDALPEAAEDEYDPRRPLMMQPPEQSPDPSQFDTDLVRKESWDGTAQTVATIPLTNASSTISRHARAPATEQAASGMDRSSRSPSVGRPHSGLLNPVEDTSAASGTKSLVTPDIASILQSLTTNALSTPNRTPPNSLGRHADISRYHTSDAYRHGDYEPCTASTEMKTQGPQLGHASYLSPSVFSVQQLEELQASLANSNWQSASHHASAPQASYAPGEQQLQHSPPHRPAYDDDQRFMPVPIQAPAYREAPVQYLQIPASAHEPVHIDYRDHYDRARPVSYVDQYGRPLDLIPIEAGRPPFPPPPPPAPPPVQYVSALPYHDQPHYGRAQTVYATAAPSPPQLQPVFDNRRSMYYEMLYDASTGMPR